MQKLDLRERQFEDNTTKALVNVLEHGDLLQSFHQEILGLPAKSVAGAAAYALQSKASETDATSRYIVGISSVGEIDPKSWTFKQQPASGRVDAEWRLGDQLVLLETKVVEFMDGPQLNRHAKDWGVEQLVPAEKSLPDSWKLVTWAQIYRWADQRAIDGQVSPVARFLAAQLREYLELTGLAPFSGWRKEHFEYFKLSQEARRAGEQIEVAEQIKTRLEGTWGVVKELAPETYSRLGEIRVGRLAARYDHAWAETHSGSDLPNLSVEIGAADLQLNLTSWNYPQAIRFEKWLQGGEPAAAALRQLDDHELVVMKRRAKVDRKGRPFWMVAPYDVLGTFNPAEIAVDPRGFLETWRIETDPTWERLAYHVRRSWLPTEVASSGPGFIPVLVSAIDRLLPVLEEVQHAGSRARANELDDPIS